MSAHSDLHAAVTARVDELWPQGDPDVCQQAGEALRVVLHLHRPHTVQRIEPCTEHSSPAGSASSVFACLRCSRTPIVVCAICCHAEGNACAELTEVASALGLTVGGAS